jgi:hypothetical protein
MTSLKLDTYLFRVLDKIEQSYYCKLTHALLDYKETSALLQAAGHETVYLDKEIDEIQNSIIRLKIVNAAAVLKFRKEGINICTDTDKPTEDELDRLT